MTELEHTGAAHRTVDILSFAWFDLTVMPLLNGLQFDSTICHM